MRQIIAAATLAILISGVVIALIVGWKLALTAAVINIAVVLAGLAARALRRASRHTDRIIREEVDAHREHADTPTYDLTVTNPHNPNDTPRTHRGLTIGQLADHLDAHDVRTYLAEADAATVTAPDGHQLTWKPSTDTTGETR
jgi:hypothetical protein